MNDLRGSVDGWDFKSYVLGMLFYRLISENLTAYINAGDQDAGDIGFDYERISGRQTGLGCTSMVEEKGFFICPSDRDTHDAIDITKLSARSMRISSHEQGRRTGSRSVSKGRT